MLDIAPEVARAFQTGVGVVALESSVIAQGLPAPHNIEAFRRCEAAVREAGAVPATIAVVRGRIRVGLSEEEAAALAVANPRKLSCSDVGCALGTGADGATTVSATVAVAARVGIRVVATGGIGGVHRGVEETLDISADLDEIARQSVAVVCAGAKAILDLPRTVERLETLGVPVIGFRTNRFPAFYHADSGIDLTWRVDEPEAVALILRAHWRGFGRGTGALIVQAPPRELDRARVDEAVVRALDEAAKDGVRGKALTPFLLSRVAAWTGGDSLDVNLDLLEANAGTAGLIAAALAGGAGGNP